MKQGIRDCCIDSRSGPDAKCCGNYKDIPGPIAGPKTAFGSESYTLGCPVDEITPEVQELCNVWAVCDGDPRAYFGGGVVAADNRMVEAMKVLDQEAALIRQANQPKAK